jgi:hypothetical protein
MASLPNLEPFRPSSPDITEPMVRPPRKPVSFNIASGQSAGGEGESAPVVPFPMGSMSRVPSLPKGKHPIFSRHRHDANPALALKVLQDIQMAVESWHGELRQTVQQIQDLYMEGPIVDGWLETLERPAAPQPAVINEAALLRHADPEDLSGYVERLCAALEAGEPQGSTDPTVEIPAAAAKAAPSYRLCNLNADGQLQCMPCPPEQVSTLSLAIARHQKLRQLLDQKGYLEAKLKRAVDLLTGSRNSLGIAPTCSSALGTDSMDDNL